MYILDFLRGLKEGNSTKQEVTYEYRLICSGELYNSQVLTSDWRKSTLSRILLNSPAVILVCSHPFNQYPQELALRFETSLVREQSGNATTIFYPHRDIARDLAVLLSLLCRRLITIGALIREITPKGPENQKDVLFDYPIGFIRDLNPLFWPAEPILLFEGRNGIQVEEYNPPPLGVDPGRLEQILLALPKSQYAESLILSARLYWIALQQIKQDANLTYQLLVASVESLANPILRMYLPSDEERIASKATVLKLAKEYGLSEQQSRELALEASKGIPWALQKFIRFITDNTTDEFWTEDNLFKIPESVCPRKEDFESALRQIYSARSKLVHEGRSFPASSAIGTGARVESKTTMELTQSIGKTPFPPVVWFERLVNHVINTFIERSIPLRAQPKKQNSS